MLTISTHAGKISEIQAKSEMTKSNTKAQANPTNDTQRARTDVRSQMVDVTIMNTAAILTANVFIRA